MVCFRNNEKSQANILTQNILATRIGRLSTFGILYIAEGVPLGFTATAMAAYMRREGLDVSQIGATVGMPLPEASW